MWNYNSFRFKMSIVLRWCIAQAKYRLGHAMKTINRNDIYNYICYMYIKNSFGSGRCMLHTWNLERRPGGCHAVATEIPKGGEEHPCEIHSGEDVFETQK